MSETSPPPVPHDSIWNHPVAIVGAAAAGAAILAGTLYLAGILVAGDTGDEPPIRVKNGSVDFYLASRKDTWKKKHDKLFTITGGKRSKDALDVVVALIPGGTGSCNAQTDTGDLVTLEYVKSDASVVTLTIGTDPDQPKNKHSAVQSAEPLTLSGKDRTLSFANVGGYIRSIKIDQKEPMCKFTAANQLDTILIMDY